MEVFPYSWNTFEEYGSLGIRIFGLNKNNESVFILVNDFRPYVYLELPYIQNLKWDEAKSKVQSISTKIDEVCGKFKPVERKFELKKKLYYAKKHKDSKTGNLADNLYPFLKCYFKSSTDLKQFTYKMRIPLTVGGVGKIQLKTHEGDANAVLQFMCMKNLKPAGWFKFAGHKIELEDEKQSSCVHEYVASWKNFIPIDKNTVSSPLIMGFDIEVNSSNPNIAPQHTVPEDKIFQISCVLCRNGDKEESYSKYILSLGKNKKGEDIDLIQEKVGEDVEIRLFNTESDLLMGFNEIIQELNPQIICGYNIFGFDLPYIYNRTKLNAITSMFDQLSFIKGIHSKEVKIEWSSSAFKNQNFTYLDAPGRLWIDMLPIIQRDYKLENYKLKTVSDFFLGQTKDPLTHKGIFKCYRMFTPESLSVVAKYCVKDSELVVKLFEKLQIWIGLTEMSNTCNTPIFTLFTQGQQIKIFSQVYKKCMGDNIVIDKDSFIVNENDHFTGAYVFTPVPGLYDMVVSFDFSSLYPSTIIAYNIDYSTLVLDEKIPDEKCHIFEWEDHFNCECPDSKKVKTKKIVICKKNRFRFLKEPMGVIPTLLVSLIDARKKAKKEMEKLQSTIDDIKDEKEKEEVERMITVFDKRQLAYKVSCNSMYGGMGVRRGYLPFLPGAMCTTARGRQSIEKASKFLVENYGAKLIYGDSVSGDTPILVRYEDQTVDILRIDNIGEVWKPYEEFKSDDIESNRKEKQQTLPFVSCGNYRVMNILEVWTGSEWSKVRRVIRHKTVKKMYRVLTHTGCVDVTEDHSLLDKNLNKIKPSQLNIGCELYHSFPPKEDFLDVEFKDALIEGKVYDCTKCNEHKLIFEFYSDYKICKKCVYDQNHKIERKTHNKEYISETEYIRNLSRNLNEDLAYVWGMFFAEGSCGSYECKSGTKNIVYDDRNNWAINNQDLSVLEKCKSILEKCEPLFGWKILDTMDSSSVYKLVPQGHLQYIVKKWRMMFYDKEGYKKVPYFILNSNDSIKNQFFSGYYEGDGDKHTFNRIKQFKFDIKGKIGAHGLYTLLYSLGYNIAINTKNKKDNIYTLHTCNNFRKSETEVKKIIELPETNDDEYVYDIETESGRFLGGIGKIILKNTDSCYISFPQFTTEKDAKELDMFCRKVEEETSSLFPRPMKFAYEEAIYWRYLILSKKRYMALKCDFNGKVKDKIEKRGVLLSRRDNSSFSRDFYSKIIMKTFYKDTFENVMSIVNDEVERLCIPVVADDKSQIFSGSLKAKELSISKSIGDIKDYKIKALPDDNVLCNKCNKIDDESQYCKSCKIIHLNKSKLCIKCNKKKAVINKKGLSPLYCYKCKEDDMIDVWNKKLIKRLDELKILDLEADLEIIKTIFKDMVDKNDEELEDHQINNQLEYQIVSEYINKCLPSQMQLAQKMRKRGTYVAAGERLSYVVVESEHMKDKLFEKIEDLDYFKENIKYINIDKLYYMKLMINPIDEVIEAVYKKTDIFKKIYKYRENYQKVINQLNDIISPRIHLLE